MVQQLLRQQKLDLSTYLTLYCPALDWILQCVAQGASEGLLDQVLSRCKDQCNSALLLNSVMTAFRPDYVASRALELVGLMRDCDDASFPKVPCCESSLSCWCRNMGLMWLKGDEAL